MGATRAERFVFALAGLVLAVSAVLAVQQRLAERAAERALAAGLPALAGPPSAGAAARPVGAEPGAAAGAAGGAEVPAVQAGGGQGGGPPAPPGAGPEAALRGQLVVHVAGAVQRPGVYRLPPGARVADAVAAAGGAKAQAWLDAINLAAPLADGVQVFVPARGQPAPAAAWPPAATAGDGARGGAGVAVGGAAAPLDLNAADARALEALPGIGPSLAARIVEYRARHGPFRRVEDLLAVPGIGPRTLERLRPLVVVR